MKKTKIFLATVAFSITTACPLSISIGGSSGGMILSGSAASSVASTKMMLDNRRKNCNPVMPPHDNKMSFTDDTPEDIATSYQMDHVKTYTGDN